MKSNHLRTGFALVSGAVLALASAACEIEGTPLDEVPSYQPPVTPAPEQPTIEPQARRVVILHTNDEHSHLLGFGPETEYPFLPRFVDGQPNGTATGEYAAAQIMDTTAPDETVGGIVRRQYLVNKIRAESADPVLLLSAGDSMMGTIMHMAATRAAPDQVAMTLLGYDFMTIGNHDFDWGPDAFAQTIAAAQNLTFGGMTPIVSSNIKFDDVVPGQPGGAALEALFGGSDAQNSGAPIVPWATKTLGNGLKVGFIGLLGYEAALVAVSTGNVRFSVPEGTVTCETSAECDPGFSCKLGTCVSALDTDGHVAALVSDAQDAVDAVRGQGVDLVVAITHLGMDEDEVLAQMTTGIDVIIGGHSHDEIAPTVVESDVDGQTVIVQAGGYGRNLGQLTIEVGTDGTVSHVEDGSTLHAIDASLDPQILADQTAFTNAITLTTGIIGPVIGQLDQAFAPVLSRFGLSSFLEPAVASGHDIVGEEPSVDTNLSHLVTDAERAVIGAQACPVHGLIVAEANGVLRESLRFGAPNLGDKPSTSAADVFRVVPLGASPYETTVIPGFPLLMFQLAGAELYAGMDVGVTMGLDSDSFFLSYAGAQVEFDESLPPFDPAKALADNPDAGGRVLKIALGTDAGYSEVIYQRTADQPWAQGWVNVGLDPEARLFTVVTNLYLAGFLNAFGLVPRDVTGTPVGDLSRFVLCSNPLASSTDCGAGTAQIDYCASIDESLGGDGIPPWDARVIEVKEWTTLLGYLRTLQGTMGGIPDGLYEGDVPAVLRVVPTP